jgi:phosphoribosylformylglycinamidine cyclo-ligase
LIRRVLAEHGDAFSKQEIVSLLAPTRLYHDVVADIKAAGVKPRAMAHITGGGLPENLERLLPNHGADVVIPNWDNAAMKKLFGFVDAEDKFHTFNMGFGWVVIVSPDEAESIMSAGPGGVRIGTISSTHGVRVSMES